MSIERVPGTNTFLAKKTAQTTRGLVSTLTKPLDFKGDCKAMFRGVPPRVASGTPLCAAAAQRLVSSIAPLPFYNENMWRKFIFTCSPCTAKRENVLRPQFKLSRAHFGFFSPYRNPPAISTVGKGLSVCAPRNAGTSTSTYPLSCDASVWRAGGGGGGGGGGGDGGDGGDSETDSSSGDDTDNTGAIVGGVIGGLAFGLLFFACMDCNPKCCTEQCHRYARPSPPRCYCAMGNNPDVCA